jgi:flagellar assembly protein FliH
MIIKGAALDSTMRSWRAPASSREMARGTAVEAETVASAVVPAASPPVVAPSSAPVSPTAVIEWLSSQPAPIRTQIAHALSDDLEALRERAFTEATELGKQEGQRLAQEHSRRLLKTLESIRDEYQRSCTEALTKLQDSTEVAVVAVLEKLLGPAMTSELGVVAAVSEILATVTPSGSIRIGVHRDDVPWIVAAQEQLEAALGTTAFQVVSDERVQLGGCLIEGDHGLVDGRLETQLDNLRATLLEHRRATSSKGSTL